MKRAEHVLLEETYPASQCYVPHFFKFDARHFHSELIKRNEAYWVRRAQAKAMRLFHHAARRVPAYADFLKKNHVRPRSIRTIEDFARVPATTKKNYIRAYPLEQRCWNGALEHSALGAVSSGTSGEPVFWPRGEFQEFEAACVHDLLYSQLFGTHKKKTLMIIGFPMGAYVSGIATSFPSMLCAAKQKTITVFTAGNKKEDILRLVPELQKPYDQLVLVGHPFFIKDVIETGKEQNIRWNKTMIKMMFCSEGFSEHWRDVLASSLSHTDGNKDMLSVYGSSELLLMGYETPFSVHVRRRALANEAVRRELFGEDVVPHLFQYHPMLRYIETHDSNLLFTSSSGIPLIRYDLHDRGAVLGGRDVHAALAHDTPGAAGRASGKKDAWNLPFVALWGRSDRTMIFYAANIYPENIQHALGHKTYVRACTGKFVMRKGYKKNMDEYLEIHVELRKGRRKSKEFSDDLIKHIVSTLEKVNMEYGDARRRFGTDTVPRVILWKYQSERFFKPGIKPRYIEQ